MIKLYNMYNSPKCHLVFVKMIFHFQLHFYISPDIDIPSLKTKMQYFYRYECTLREESSQTNFILQYKLLAAILIAVCSVIQQS